MQKSKYLVILLFFISFSWADILYVPEKRCILDNYFFQDGLFHYTYSSTGTGDNESTNIFNFSDLEYGYEYINNKCQKIQVLKDIQMEFHDFKLMTALTGLLIGFSIFISVIFMFLRRV